MDIKNIFNRLKANNMSTKIFFLAVPLLGIIVLSITIALLLVSPGATAGKIQIDSPVKDSQLIFNNQVYYAPVTINNISSGTYVIVVHNEGFEDEQHTVTVKEGEITNLSLKMSPLPLEQSIITEEKLWLPYFDSEAVKENNTIQIRENKYPLTIYLPEFFGNIMLDYEVNGDGSVQYIVRALPNQSYTKNEYQQVVDDFIKSKGIDPATIQITWK